MLCSGTAVKCLVSDLQINTVEMKMEKLYVFLSSVQELARRAASAEERTYAKLELGERCVVSVFEYVKLIPSDGPFY